jgi:inward rectifier potassium channel
MFWAMTAPMSEEASNPVPPSLPRLGGDGSLSPVFLGHGKDGWRDAYHYLLTMPLIRFLGVLAAAYVSLNAVFGLAYLLVGGVSGLKPGDYPGAFFFSVETMSTVGYGEMWPQSLGAHSVMVVESFVGLLNLAIATGLLFARFSRPTARVMFSDRAVVTDLNGTPTLMLRAANRRRNRIVEAEVTLNLLRDVTSLEGDSFRRFETLEALRARTPVFTLSWQIMHRIDEASPLFGETAQSLAARRAEIVVVVKGLDETFAQTIHARGSYTPDEIVWGAKLVDIFGRDAAGRPVIDFTHFHDIV